MKRSLFSQISLAGFLLITGVLVVAQLRTQRHLRVVTYDRDEQAILLSELVEANRRLRDEVELLNTQLVSYQEENRGAVLEDLVAELNRVRVLNGMVEVSGPGIELLIDGPVSALDLQDLVNEVRNAGAEAISLNDQRIVINSVFMVGEKGTILLDGQSLRRPYRMQAIGDPDTIEGALLRPGGLVQLLKHQYPNIFVQSLRQTNLVLGVHRPQVALEYAQPFE